MTASQPNWPNGSRAELLSNSLDDLPTGRLVNLAQFIAARVLFV